MISFVQNQNWEGFSKFEDAISNRRGETTSYDPRKPDAPDPTRHVNLSIENIKTKNDSA